MQKMMIINVYANMSWVYVDKLRGANHNKIIIPSCTIRGKKKNEKKQRQRNLNRTRLEWKFKPRASVCMIHFILS